MKISAAILALLLAASASASPGEEVVARFLDVLRRDDLTLLAQLVDPTQTDGRAWEEFRTAVDLSDCLTIDRYEWSLTSATEDRISLRLVLDGTAALKATWRPVKRLPRIWNIEARRTGDTWRLWRAMSEERRVALEMANAGSVADVDRIAAAARDVNMLEVIKHYGRELSDKHTSFDHALSLARATGDVSTEADVLRNQAIALWSQPEQMLAVARSEEELARTAGTLDDLATARLTLGLAYIAKNDMPSARAVYAAGAEMVEALDDPTRAMKCLQMVIHTSKGATSQLVILRDVETLDGLARRFGWEEGVEVALFDLGELHGELGNLDAARAYFETLLDLGEKHGNDRFVTFALVDLAANDLRGDRFEDAIAHARKVFEHPSGDAYVQADALRTEATAHIHLRQFDEAQQALDRAQALDVNGAIPAVLVSRSQLQLLRGDVNGAIELAREGLRKQAALAADGSGFRYQAMLLGALARALHAAGRNDDAITELRAAIEAVENAREQLGADPLGLAAFLQDFVGYYIDLVERLVERGDVDEAFRVAEQMKSRGLREAIAGSHIDLSASLSAEERARERTVEGRVVELNRALFAAKQKNQATEELERELLGARAALDVFRSEIRLKHPGVGRRRADAAASPELPDGPGSLALIEYVVAEQQVIAFVVRRDAPIHAVRIPISSKQLVRDTGELESLLGARSPEYGQAARRLYKTLVTPLESELPDAATLAIVPDGVLWTVPFHALVRNDGRYLIERHTVFYAPSLHLLRQASSINTADSSLLFALGNPKIGTAARSTVRSVFRNAPLDSLVDAELEVRSLSSMYPAGRKQVYYGGDATETAFKNEAPRFNIIHIAAHAFVDDRAPMYSAIVLAKGKGEGDGLLEAREVADLSLNANLAVLSACETARGKVGAGEGVIGLSWAFFAAGCPTTVVSQWRAESAATARLMIEFHRRLRAGETTADALRHAQIAVRGQAKYRHPFYWAPFIAVGAAGS